MRRLAWLIAFFVCGPVTAQTPPSRHAIGIAVPTSGKYAPLGKQLVEAARLAAHQTQTRIVVADTEGDPTKAVEAIATLAADPDVVAIVGPVGQRESRAAASAAQRFAVPLFALSNSETVNQAGGWVFRVRNSPAEQARAMARIARTDLESKRTAILYPKTDYGREAALAFADEFARNGGVVAAVANYPEDMTNFSDVLEVVVGKKVYLGKSGTVDRWKTDASGFARVRRRAVVDFDTLFIPDFGGRVARILPFLPAAGLQNGNGGEGVAVQLLGLAGWQAKAMQLTRGTAAGALYIDTFAGESAGGRAEEFTNTFETHTGRKPVDIEAETYDMVLMLADLVSTASPEQQASMRPSLVVRLRRAAPWKGAAGAVRFGASGEPKREFGVYRFDADGFVAPHF